MDRVGGLRSSKGFTILEVLTTLVIVCMIGLVITQVSVMGMDLAKNTEHDLKGQNERALMRMYLSRHLAFASDLVVENNLENLKNCCTTPNGKIISSFRSNEHFRKDEAIPLMIFNRYVISGDEDATAAGVQSGLQPTAMYFIPPNTIRPGRLIISTSKDGNLSSHVIAADGSYFDNIVEMNIGPITSSKDFEGNDKVQLIPLEIVTRKWTSVQANTRFWCPQEFVGTQCNCINKDKNGQCIPAHSQYKDEKNIITISVVNNYFGLSNSLVGEECRNVKINVGGAVVNKDKWFRRRIPERKNGPAFYFPLRMPILNAQAAVGESKTEVKKEEVATP